MRFFYLLILLFLLTSSFSYSQQYQAVVDFTVKENLLQNNKLAVIALDSLNQPNENTEGTFQFSFNGFKQELKFNDGVAVCPMEIDKSTFIYIKHTGVKENVSHLYYLLKTDETLKPIQVNPYLLLLIPAGLILLGYLFRRLIGIIIFFFLLFVYFNYSKGLSFPTFLESVFDALRNLF